MKVYRLDNMTRGWFVGNFDPSAFKSDVCEVAVKAYKKGEREEKHYHKVATEITVITEGRVIMFEQVFGKGDVIVVEPRERTSFESLTDSQTVVVKIPAIQNDKYVVEENKDA